MKRKRRLSTPAQRVAQACENGRDVDFDYDETTDVLQIVLDTICDGAQRQQARVSRIADRIRELDPVDARDAMPKANHG